MAAPVVVRFAPSPTGPPHLGSLRTALFNWLLARANGGRFILRIEDTDRSRYDPDAEAQMLSALQWLGLSWDAGPDRGGPEGPYHQSARLELYRDAADALVAAGAASRPAEEPGVVRLHTPEAGTLSFEDAIRGTIRFGAAEIPRSPVLLKSDGYPTYHLAAVVDDHMMGITHVLRGEEWIPSTPLHLLIYHALGWAPPIFAHLPLVTDAHGQKLKKRSPHSVAQLYQEQGFLPQAVMNYLALLGWHPGTAQEVFSPAELIGAFSLERLSSSAAAYDHDRMLWFNRQHMARLPLDDLAARTVPLLREAYPEAEERAQVWLRHLIEIVRDELETLTDVVPAARWAFGVGEMTPAARDALASEPARPVLEAFRAALLGVAVLDAETSAALLRDLRAGLEASHGWQGREVMFPLRAALTGSVEGPHLAAVLDLLEKDALLARVDAALSLL